MITVGGDELQRPARCLAFHLPQFHPIPENDAMWGTGFTEWTNVAKARRLYPGHHQPHVPADLGFYDLRLAESREAQAELAASFGIEGFIHWHYWFGGRKVLERPVEEILRSGSPNFGFALAWANETWTGIWYGDPDRIAIEQTYPGPDDERAHFDELLPYFRDERYLTVDGRPIFYVFRPQQLPDPSMWVEQWRTMADAAGLPGLYLIAEISGHTGRVTAEAEMFAAGFDAGMHLRIPFDSGRVSSLVARSTKRIGLPEVHRYARHPVDRPELTIENPVFPCVFPNWDNTPRSGRRGVVAHGSSPERFRVHVRDAIDRLTPLPSDQRLLFVKSWNEWAEGNHLEPDLRWGTGYLKVLDEELTR